jgi:hypothetical protein
MGLFETPLLLGLVALGAAALVILRWRHRRPDEWKGPRYAHEKGPRLRPPRSP